MKIFQFEINKFTEVFKFKIVTGVKKNSQDVINDISKNLTIV